MRIRRADEDEWEHIRDVRLRALLDAPDAFGSTFEGEAEDRESEWRSWVTGWDGSTDQALFVADGEEGLDGLALGVRWKSEPDLTHLYAMWVAPESRRVGLGGILTDEVVAWATGIGANALELAVTASNDAAIALYERCGFTDTAERSSLRDGSEILVMKMRKALR